MKTFTLRLNETEAEALDRMAAVEGISKNELLRAMIVRKYTGIDSICAWIEDELLMITDLSDFTAAIEQTFNEREINGTHIKEKEVIRAYDYAMDNEQDETILESIKANKERFIKEVIENKFY